MVGVPCPSIEEVGGSDPKGATEMHIPDIGKRGACPATDSAGSTVIRESPEMTASQSLRRMVMTTVRSLTNRSAPSTRRYVEKVDREGQHGGSAGPYSGDSATSFPSSIEMIALFRFLRTSTNVAVGRVGAPSTR